MDFDIDQVAQLARLNLKPDEKKKLEKNIESILGYVRKLESLDTHSVEPTSHVLDLENVFRKDEVKPCKIREDVLKHAPSTEGNLFKIPKVVERE